MMPKEDILRRFSVKKPRVLEGQPARVIARSEATKQSLSFSHDLLRWYQKNKRDLPWRRTKDPYKIWISEIMLQQTTVNTVIFYYEKWVNKFPTVNDLAKAPIQEILKEWQGLGYYNRAKNLHKAAQIIIDKHKGIIPKDAKLVRDLPGFGPYSTGSVLSIAYDMPLTIIDANVRRVVMRLLSLEGFSDTKQDIKVNEFLLKVLPLKKVGDFNQGLMELGALICKPKQPSCLICPVSKYCQVFKESRQDVIPQFKKKDIKEIHAVIAIIKKEDTLKGSLFYIQKRPSKGLMADLWEFPGGKIEEGETEKKALVRELKEEINVQLKSSKYLFKVTHFYTQFKVNLSVYACQVKNAPPIDDTHLWVSFNEFSKYPIPSGTAKVIKRLFSG